MKYFDLHCDTAADLYRRGLDFTAEDQQVNRFGFSHFEKCRPCFAVFSNDVTVRQGIDYFRKVADYFKKIIAEEKNVEPILTTEGGQIIEGDLANLDVLKSYGVRIFGFSWNGENALAAGNFFDPTYPLTNLGIKALARLEELNIYPDVSHLSDQGVKDILTHTHQPVIATHSNCRSVWDHPRNITDDQIRGIYQTGGIVGLNLYTDTISEKGTLEDLLFHIDRFLELGGEKQLCLGADWDGMDPPPPIRGIEGILLIHQMITDHFSKEIADRIIYQNGCDFFGFED